MGFSKAALAIIVWILPPVTLAAVVGPRPSGEGTVDLTTRYQAAWETMIRTRDYDGPFDMFQIYPNQSADPTKDTSFKFNDPNPAVPEPNGPRVRKRGGSIGLDRFQGNPGGLIDADCRFYWG